MPCGEEPDVKHLHTRNSLEHLLRNLSSLFVLRPSDHQQLVVCELECRGAHKVSGLLRV
jgi:hypothetical protein